MKKLLITILSTILLVSMGTTNIFAEDEDVKNITTGELYATLQDAIDSVDNGETIVILKDEISYSTPITIDNGKTFTIDFKDDGSTQHSFRWSDMEGTQKDKDIFTISNNSNVTVKDMQYKIGLGERGNRVFLVNSTGTLTLKGMICNSVDNIKDTPVRNTGGTVTIDGGDITTDVVSETDFKPTNPIVQNLGGTTTIKGNGTYKTHNNFGAVWVGRDITMADQSTDADRDSECGTVIIENGTFNNGHIVDVNGKGTITINNATYTSGNGPIIRTFHGGIKSNITINNITTSSTVFAQVIEELQTKIDFRNGNVKYTPTRFCINQTGSAAMTSVSIKNGKFGPKTGTTEIHDEINNLLATGATLTALTGDPGGYTYQVETVTPPPAPPTPPTPTPEPNPEPTPVYIIPNTGVEGTPTNNHSLLKLSSLSLLAIGTYMVIKKKKDN